MIFGLLERTGRFACKWQDALCRYTVQRVSIAKLNLTIKMRCLFYIGNILSGLA